MVLRIAKLSPKLSTYRWDTLYKVKGKGGLNLKSIFTLVPSSKKGSKSLLPTFQVEKYLKRFTNQIENSDLKKIVRFYGNETKVKKSFVIKPHVLDFRKQFYFCHSLKKVPKGTKSI